ncbi:MAG: DUF1778 domain-containing protein, partial [Gammaproteobacteria bacterium]|nr:DUF1778 domain-containing protein [Gammaproteobacteria bacterium]
MKKRFGAGNNQPALTEFSFIKLNDMTAIALKEEQISIRATSELKNMFVQAAALSGMTMTDFLLFSAHKAAERVIAESESETVILNNEERDRFLALLDSPPPPNTTLKAAMQRHKALL